MGQKFFKVQKYFGSEKILGQKKKKFGIKKILSQKNFRVKNFSGQNIGGSNNFGGKKSLVKKIWVRKIFVTKNIRIGLTLHDPTPTQKIVGFKLCWVVVSFVR